MEKVTAYDLTDTLQADRVIPSEIPYNWTLIYFISLKKGQTNT